MAVFRVERNKGYTVMSNHHLRNKELSLKAKGLLSQMLSLPEDWDYTLKGLSLINREKIDAIREAIKELERAGYIVRSRERDEKGRLRGADYVIFEQPQPPTPDLPTLENPTLDNPTQEKPTLEKPTFRRYAAMFRVGTSFIFSSIKSRSASVTLNLICTVLLRPSMCSLLSFPFRSEGLGHFPTSHFQPTRRSAGGGKYGSGYPLPMLATNVFIL